MKLLEEYESLFGIKPPKLMMISYDDEIYQKLMEEAITRGTPLTESEIEEAFSDIQFDIFQKSFDSEEI